MAASPAAVAALTAAGFGLSVWTACKTQWCAASGATATLLPLTDEPGLRARACGAVR
jgi:hypothetical protein